MVHLPFSRKSDKSELVKMAIAERARHSNEQPSGSQETVTSPREKLTDSKETPSEQKPVLPILDTGGRNLMARETRVGKSRGRSGSPPDYNDLMRPLSPPEFPQRAGSSSPVQATASPAESTKSKKPDKSSKKQLKSPTSQKSPSISLRGRNPFSNTQASGDTPEMPQGPDPLLDCMLRMRNVNAEQVATVVTPHGPRSSSPGKGEFVTDDKANNWIYRQIVTDSSTEATGVLPAMTGTKKRTIKVFPIAKATRKRSSSSRPSEDGRSTSLVDYLHVDIPHIDLDTESIWPEMHAEVEQMP